jgi:hypothetical protein
LTDRNGETLGRVVSITIDDSSPPTTERAGDRERRSSAESTAGSEGTKGDPHTPRPTAAQLEHAAVVRCWKHWLSASGRKQKLDDKRERILRNAIRLVGEERTNLALTGLTRSPHHRGENEQHREYMEIRYALKGLGAESDDERIEKAILWGAVNAPGAIPVNHDKVTRYLGDVKWTAQYGTERERGEFGLKWLRDNGFRVTRFAGAPWAEATR